MTTHHHVPSEDEVDTLDALITRAHDAECGCAECGTELHPPVAPLRHDHVDVVIDESAAHLADGYGD